MVFHWGLSDSRSPQISRALLSILADLNDTVVWMVSTLPLISKSSSPCTNPLVTVQRASITIVIIVIFMFHAFFNSQARSRYLSLISHSLISLCGQPGQQSPQFCKFSFFGVVVIDYYKIWSSGRDLVIRLYLEIPEEFVHCKRKLLWL